MYISSKDSIVCFALSKSFLYALYFCNTCPYPNCFLSVNPHATAVVIGMTIEPTPVTDHVKDVVAAGKATMISFNFVNLDDILYFLETIPDFLFSFGK